MRRRQPVTKDDARADSYAALLVEILRDVGRGDAAAFELLFTTIWSQVRDRAWVVVRDRALAEEVAQEVLIEVWRTASRFDPDRGTALAWLMTMAQRRSVDRVRSEASSRRRDEVSTLEGDALNCCDDIAELVSRRVDQERVREGLAFLTPLQLQAVTLAFYGGLTYREVARELGVPLSTTKTRIRDGLQRLAQAVDVREFDAA